jgi:hypothetical protein
VAGDLAEFAARHSAEFVYDAARTRLSLRTSAMSSSSSHAAEAVRSLFPNVMLLSRIPEWLAPQPQSPPSPHLRVLRWLEVVVGSCLFVGFFVCERRDG